MTHTLHTLTATIKNPDFDKRRKYGYMSLPEFKAGRTFTIYPKDDRSPAIVDLGGDTVSGKLAETIIAHSEPTQAKTWRDIALACGGYHNCADDVIDQLLAVGIVTPAQVMQALTDFLAK